MLIETNTSPMNTIYFLGSQVIELFLHGLISKNMVIDDMYKIYLEKFNRDIGIVKFIYVLDRLFIIGLIDLNNSYIEFKHDNK